MRQHGIDMPDPKFDAGGRVTQELRAGPGGNGPNSPKFKEAQEACRQYQPDGGQPIRPNAQEQQRMLEFAGATVLRQQADLAGPVGRGR
jgi:hypothetical protein